LSYRPVNMFSWKWLGLHQQQAAPPAITPASTSQPSTLPAGLPVASITTASLPENTLRNQTCRAGLEPASLPFRHVGCSPRLATGPGTTRTSLASDSIHLN